MRALLLLLCLCVSAPSWAGEKIAVMELFTSQGCSASPAAEENFSHFANLNHANLITLSCHITHFDQNLPENTLSRSFCDDRLKYYKRRINSLQSGTPYMVLNGRFSTYGMKRNIVESGLNMAHSLDEIAPITLTLSEEALEMSLPAIASANEMDIWIFAYDKNTQASSKDTNAPIFSYVTKHLEHLMTWDGTAQSLSFPLNGLPADGYAIIAQEKGYGPIAAAAKIEG